MEDRGPDRYFPNSSFANTRVVVVDVPGPTKPGTRVQKPVFLDAQNLRIALLQSIRRNEFSF